MERNLFMTLFVHLNPKVPDDGYPGRYKLEDQCASFLLSTKGVLDNWN